MAMTDISKKSKKMLLKYPDHVPVVCSSSRSSGCSTQKLLVPKQMSLSEFLATARQRCSWGKPDSEVTLGNGNPLPKLESMKEIYLAHKNSDELLQVLVRSRCNQPEEEQVPIADVGKESSSSDAKRNSLNSLASQPQVFHMPDNEDSVVKAGMLDKLDKQAERSRRLQKKYPDRVPVLVKQAQSIGLPEIDKKLLVPKTMTCAGLRQILPNHVGGELKGDDWKKLMLYMGDDPLEENTLMSEVYDQYVDEQDVCLHITLRMDLPCEHKPNQEREQAEFEAVQAELKETKEQLEKAHAKLEELKEKASRVEEQNSSDTEKRLEAECKIIQLEESLASETEKVKQLESKALEASERERLLHEEFGTRTYECAQLQACAVELQEQLHSTQKQLECTIAQKDELGEALVSQNRANEAEWAAKREAAEGKAVEAEVAKEAANTKANNLEKKLAAMEQMLEREKAEKIALQKEMKDLQEGFRKEKEDLLVQVESARDGFVHIDCNEFGLLQDEEENGFKVVSPDP